MWRNRYLAEGLAGLDDRPKKGREPTRPGVKDQLAQIVNHPLKQGNRLTLCPTTDHNRLTLPASPTTTGKIERFHLTLRRELLDDHDPFVSLAATVGRVDPLF